MISRKRERGRENEKSKIRKDFSGVFSIEYCFLLFPFFSTGFVEKLLRVGILDQFLVVILERRMKLNANRVRNFLRGWER